VTNEQIAERGMHLVAMPERTSDAERAQSLKDRMTDVLGTVAALHQEAYKHGLRIEATIAPDGFGQWRVHNASVLKAIA